MRRPYWSDSDSSLRLNFICVIELTIAATIWALRPPSSRSLGPTPTATVSICPSRPVAMCSAA